LVACGLLLQLVILTDGFLCNGKAARHLPRAARTPASLGHAPLPSLAEAAWVLTFPDGFGERKKQY
jgi:hypothetical protein